VGDRGLEGLGEKKSNRLNPFHLGSLFFEGILSVEVPLGINPIAAATIPEFLMNDLLFIRDKLYI
jgi:hypothetical protein